VLIPPVALPSFLFAGTIKDFTFKFWLLWLQAGSLEYRSLSFPSACGVVGPGESIPKQPIWYMPNMH